MIHVLHRYASAVPRLRSRATSATNAEEANKARPRNFSEVRSRRRYAVAAILACLSLALLPANAAAQPPLVDIGTLGGDSAYPNAINAAGQVVGGANIAGNSEQHAFLWTPNSPNGTTGTWTDLGKLGGVFSYAYGINDVGEVVGMTNMPPDADGNTVGDQAFLWTASTGTMTPLGTLGGWASQASGLNNSHQVVGWSHWTSVSPHENEVHAVLWTNGGMFDLGTLPGATDSMATAISADGKVVGFSMFADESMHAFLWTPSAPNATGDSRPGRES